MRREDNKILPCHLDFHLLMPMTFFPFPRVPKKKLGEGKSAVLKSGEHCTSVTNIPSYLPVNIKHFLT